MGDLIPQGSKLDTGTYRLAFGTGACLARQGQSTFFPEVSVVFEVRATAKHHHVPLLLSPFGYTAYRGS